MAATYQTNTNVVSNALENVLINVQGEVDRILERASVFLEDERDEKNDLLDLDDEHLSHAGATVGPVGDESVRIYPGKTIEAKPEPVLAPLLPHLTHLARTGVVFLTHIVELATSKLQEWDEQLHMRTVTSTGGEIVGGLPTEIFAPVAPVAVMATKEEQFEPADVRITLPVVSREHPIADHSHKVHTLLDTTPHNLPTMYSGERYFRDDAWLLSIPQVPALQREKQVSTPTTYEQTCTSDVACETEDNVKTDDFNEYEWKDSCVDTVQPTTHARVSRIAYCVLISLFREART